MQATRLTSSTHEEGVSAIDGATVQRTRWWETAYTAVNWDYPPSPAACYDALLSRGASHSRFLRIAYLSTRERSSTPAPPFPTVSLSPTSAVGPLDASTTPTSPLTPACHTSTSSPAGSPRKPAVRLPPIHPYSLSRPRVNVRPRFANPTSHVLKRRKSQWPKPPHYHASLLRSPLSHRKGLFRAILPPNQAVDFFRRDILGGDVSLSAPCQERDRTKSSNVDECPSLLVAQSVLEPYEAAAGFFGWHGLGLDVIRRVQGNDDEGVDEECCWSGGVEMYRLGLEHDGAVMSRSPDLQLEINEAVVEEGRVRWVRTAEELVGPPGLALPWVVEEGGSGKVTMVSASAHKGIVDSRVPSSISSRREEVRWDPDIDFGPSRPSRLPSPSVEKRQTPPSGSIATVLGPSSISKLELKTDLPSAWWYGPSPHRGPLPTPRLPSLCFPPPPSVQYGPPLQFSPWFPPGRVASAQGHGYWYGAQPTGAPSVNPDPNPSNSLPPHSHIFATPVTPTYIHPSQSFRYPIKPSSGRDEYGLGHDCDKETETDHGYESTTTTTDSDPPPHTPIGAATTSHSVEALQVHGDDEVDVHGVEIDAGHAAASVTIGLSDPTTPVKLLGRFSMSTSPSVSSGSPGYNRDGYGSSKTAVVFPSLNGSFRQGSLSQMSVPLSNREMSAQTTPGRTVTPVSASSLSSAKESTTRLGLGVEDDSKIKLKSGGACSVSGDSPAFMLRLCSPPPTSPSPLRKDSQGFWEPATPSSPSSSSSSLPLSPSEGKMRSRPTAAWINGEKTGSVPGGSSDSSEAASSQYTLSAKSRSLSPGPCRVTSAGSNHSSSSRPASFSSPTSTPASTSVFGGSYPSSPSPTNYSSLVTPNPTTLLPAFLATATVKRKKASRTREIVDRLRSSSIDAGKGNVGLDGSGWLARPSAGGEEQDSTLDKVSSASDHAAGSQPSPSPPSKSSSDSASWLGSDLGTNHGQSPRSKSAVSGSSGSRAKSNGVTQVAVFGSETFFSRASAGTITTTGITPFPVLSVSQSPASNFTITHQSQTGGINGREHVTPTASDGGDGSKVNATVVTSPNTRSSGPQILPRTPNSGTSPSTHHPPHPLPSPSHLPAHPQPPLGPPPMLTVSPYPHPMYVPFTQYHLASPHQVQQGQGTWLAVYPGRPPHLPVHPLPVQTHVPSITGVPGMRHVSW